MSPAATPSDPQGWAFETRQIHAGQEPDPGSGSRALPIHQTTSFVFPDAQTAAARFALSELGPIYTRLNNPTTEVVENRIASLEGGVGALMVSSGQAASTLAILNLVWVALAAGGGVLFPTSVLPGWISWLVDLLPSAAAGELLRSCFLAGQFALLPALVLAVWAALSWAATVKWFKWV